MKAILTVEPMIAARSAPSNIRRSLWDQEWTSDGETRFTSTDFAGANLGNAKAGVPAQKQTQPNVWIKLTRMRQLWLFDVLCLSGYGKLPSVMTRTELAAAKTQWASFMTGYRCFTNGAGWDDGKADYIQGKNIGAAPMEWEPLLLSGNVVELTGETKYIIADYTSTMARQPLLHYRVRSVDPDALPDPADFLHDKCVCHLATTIRPDGSHGVFPQFNERSVYPIWGREVWVWERLIR